jgi:hypothetical protein
MPWTTLTLSQASDGTGNAAGDDVPPLASGDMAGTSMWWHDRQSAWWVKTERAQAHIDSLRRQVTAFVGDAYAVETEPGPTETVYRLHMHRAIPTGFEAILGDALHNLRSSLDCAASAVAQRHLGRDLTRAVEHATAFPIRISRRSFDAFFDKPTPSGVLRADLFAAETRAAMREVQPGSLHDRVVQLDQHLDVGDRKQEVTYDLLRLLASLNNIDKHRTLNLAVWWPDLVYWGSDDTTQHRWAWGTPPFADGAVLGRLIGPSGADQVPVLHHEWSCACPTPARTTKAWWACSTRCATTCPTSSGESSAPRRVSMSRI